MRLLWRAAAHADLQRITADLAAWDTALARDLNGRVGTCAAGLALHPYLYPAGRALGTREALIHPNYALTYRTGEETVEIVSVQHTRCRYPPAAD